MSYKHLEAMQYETRINPSATGPALRLRSAGMADDYDESKFACQQCFGQVSILRKKVQDPGGNCLLICVPHKCPHDRLISRIALTMVAQIMLPGRAVKCTM